MDIKRLRQLAGMLNESVELEEGVRDVTNRIYEAMDDGLIDPRTVAEAALSYMSEDDVADMARINEFFLYDEEDDEEDEDDMDPDYFDDLDAGDTEMDRRSDLRRGW